ncbi:hypothetical protein KY337_02965 [Candidatus Woesearchaeota archaeon]|nr:hypothetical protein [Candidatus Woesearchaeota archaeon]
MVKADLHVHTSASLEPLVKVEKKGKVHETIAQFVAERIAANELKKKQELFHGDYSPHYILNVFDDIFIYPWQKNVKPDLEKAVNSPQRFFEIFEPFIKEEIARDSYTLAKVQDNDFGFFYRPGHSPEEVFKEARRQNMLIGIQDHDTIDGWKQLLDEHPEYADFVLCNEEVTSRENGAGYNVHVGVFEINESQHNDIQSLKGDLDELLGYLRSEGVAHALDHALTLHWHGDKTLDRAQYEALLQKFPMLELSGAATPAQNSWIEAYAKKHGIPLIGGSDSHNGLVGRMYTEAEGTTKQDMLDALKQGTTKAKGQSATLGSVLSTVKDQTYNHGPMVFVAGDKSTELVVPPRYQWVHDAVKYAITYGVAPIAAAYLYHIKGKQVLKQLEQ